MANVKFTDLPNLGNIAANTIVPVVDSNTNYTVTAANLQAYVNSTTGNVTANVLVGNALNITANTASQYAAEITQLSGTGNGVDIKTGDGTGTNTMLVVRDRSGGNIRLSIQEKGTTAIVNDTISVTGNVFSTGSFSVTGTVNATSYLGDGSQLTGVVGDYGNANVAAYLPTYSGNITAAVISTTGNVTGNYIFGNGSQLTGIPSQYSNANVSAFMGAFGANSISTTGNVTASLFIGNGSGLTNLPAGILSGNLTGNISGNGFSILNVATLTSAGSISAVGNITGANINGNLTGSGALLTGVVKNIIAGTGISVSNVSGNVTVTNNNPVPYTNANVASYLPTYTGALNPSSVTASGNIAANNITATNNITLTNLTAPRIRFPAGSGLGAPTLNSYSPGTKIVLYDSVTNVAAGYAIGVESFDMWFSCDQAPNNGAEWGFKYYAGNVQIASLTGLGNFTTAGNVTAPTVRATNITANNKITITPGPNVAAGLNATLRAPLTSTSTGVTGDICWDSGYIYVCVATNTWKRATLNSF